MEFGGRIENRGIFFFLPPPFFALLLQLWEAELPHCFKLLLKGFKISNWKYTGCLSFKLKVQEPQSCFMLPNSCKHSHEALQPSILFCPNRIYYSCLSHSVLATFFNKHLNMLSQSSSIYTLPTGLTHKIENLATQYLGDITTHRQVIYAYYSCLSLVRSLDSHQVT